ncbi:hypothetical protein SARC_05228 [Sphaeroforma arctica JP610]|uniref:Uncharacterized protein n=1 Tax=Sphaeroforma arctica JP610 TaxID=667725 RepID=A0A0L0G0W8_9EUKA|nr:hypothetical protein SARC_05228 [Sphaeroforma arctica JP610]KNC82489.1 hypothetical protein SARC_05228 [Sphaeroforma arctica JP610]|eukprot:XP_014156391.1 hypothetical protein SARC_05228 [Sphaeroforma arctica JP610]
MSTDILTPLQGAFDRDKFGVSVQSMAFQSACQDCGQLSYSPLTEMSSKTLCLCSSEKKRPKKRSVFKPKLQTSIKKGEVTTVAQTDGQTSAKHGVVRPQFASLRVEVLSESVDMSESVDSLANFSNETRDNLGRRNESVQDITKATYHYSPDSKVEPDHMVEKHPQGYTRCRESSEYSHTGDLLERKKGILSDSGSNSRHLLGLPVDHKYADGSSASRSGDAVCTTDEVLKPQQAEIPRTRREEVAYNADDNTMQRDTQTPTRPVPRVLNKRKSKHRRTRSAFAPMSLAETQSEKYKSSKVSRRVSFDPSEYKYSTYSKTHYTRGFDAYSYYRNMGFAEKMQVMQEIRAVKPGAQYETLKYLGMFMLVVAVLCVQNYVIPALVA